MGSLQRCVQRVTEPPTLQMSELLLVLLAGLNQLGVNAALVKRLVQSLAGRAPVSPLSTSCCCHDCLYCLLLAGEQGYLAFAVPLCSWQLQLVNTCCCAAADRVYSISVGAVCMLTADACTLWSESALQDTILRLHLWS